MFDEKHEDRKKFVNDFYIKLGHPKIQPQQIVDNLAKLWAELKEANLAPDIPFEQFQQMVYNAYNQEMINFQLNQAFGANRAK